MSGPIARKSGKRGVSMGRILIAALVLSVWAALCGRLLAGYVGG